MVQRIYFTRGFAKEKGFDSSYLCVEHDSGENAGVLHGGAEVVERVLVVFVAAMREVEAGDVHTGSEKLFDHGNSARSWSQSADDLGLWDPPIVRQLLQYPFYVYVRHFSQAIYFSCNGNRF